MGHCSIYEALATFFFCLESIRISASVDLEVWTGEVTPREFVFMPTSDSQVLKSMCAWGLDFGEDGPGRAARLDFVQLRKPLLYILALSCITR
jgi:hypothetical protein